MCATTVYLGKKIFIVMLYSMMYYITVGFSVVLHIETRITSLMTSDVAPQWQDLLALQESIPGFLACVSYLEKVLHCLSPALSGHCLH